MSYYFDYAAATPVDARVLAAMEPYWQDRFYNPAALYREARYLKRELTTIRERAGAILGVPARDLYFTAGATEASNIAISGVMRCRPRAGLAYSNIEHDSVRRICEAYDGKAITVDSNGILDTAAMSRVVDDEVVLLCVEYVNSEIGVIQPYRELVEQIDQIRQDRAERGVVNPLYLHCDASQAPDCLQLDLSRLGADIVVINGAKLYAPKQSGLLYIAPYVDMQPLLHGGKQERGVRSGTENIAFAAGLVRALELATENRNDRVDHYQKLQTCVLERLQAISQGRLNGSRDKRIPSNINWGFAGIDGEMLLHQLDAAGFMVATGAACSANQDTPSHVLTALGADGQYVQGSIRISFGRSTRMSDAEQLVAAITDIVPQLRRGW